MAFHCYILFDTLVPASFLLIKILMVFQKAHSREELGQFLRILQKKRLSFRLLLIIYCSLNKMQIGVMRKMTKLKRPYRRECLTPLAINSTKNEDEEVSMHYRILFHSF